MEPERSDSATGFFTREIQQFLADSEGFYAAHPEVTYLPDRPKPAELKVLVVDPEEIDRRVEEVKKRFVDRFGAEEAVGVSRSATASPGRSEHWGVWGATSGPPMWLVIGGGLDAPRERRR